MRGVGRPTPARDSDAMIELAWVAGFFEGEGSVRISKPARRNLGSLTVDVPNTEVALIRPFERWGGSVSRYSPGGRRKSYWRWRAAATEAEAFLRVIRPYVISEKVREKIDLGLAFQAQKVQGNGSRGDAYREAQWVAYRRMAELNVRGVEG